MKIVNVIFSENLKAMIAISARKSHLISCLNLFRASLKIQSFKQDEARTKNVDAAYD